VILSLVGASSRRCGQLLASPPVPVAISPPPAPGADRRHHRGWFIDGRGPASTSCPAAAGDARRFQRGGDPAPAAARLFRTAYAGKTLREHYGLDWPKSASRRRAAGDVARLMPAAVNGREMSGSLLEALPLNRPELSVRTTNTSSFSRCSVLLVPTRRIGVPATMAEIVDVPLHQSQGSDRRRFDRWLRSANNRTASRYNAFLRRTGPSVKAGILWDGGNWSGRSLRNRHLT